MLFIEIIFAPSFFLPLQLPPDRRFPDGANAIVGHESADEGAENIGGVIGGATNSLIDSCSAKANIVLPDNSGKAGILCGGLEATSVVNGYATGTLTAGDGCSEIGAVAGSVSDSEEITNSR
ncbi:MAG: hypothetical protein IKO14_09685, partial [Oscillibacter sp.]|nr:hypothetical protein [Oscillibacter sp.]